MNIARCRCGAFSEGCCGAETCGILIPICFFFPFSFWFCFTPSLPLSGYSVISVIAGIHLPYFYCVVPCHICMVHEVDGDGKCCSCSSFLFLFVPAQTISSTTLVDQITDEGLLCVHQADPISKAWNQLTTNTDQGK